MNFGTPNLSTFYDQEWANGWGNRHANWEFSAGVQHELTDGLSVNVSYFRRILTNFSTTDNRAATPADYDPYCINVPDDPRLPNPGEQLCDLFQVTPAKFGLVDNITTSADNFGTETQHWNGVDLTVAARIACYEQVVKALGAVGPSNRGTDTGSGSVEPAHRASSGLIPEERRVPGGSTSSCLRREGLRTTVGMASSPVGAGASGFYAAIDSSLHTWSASNAVRFLTTANA